MESLFTDEHGRKKTSQEEDRSLAVDSVAAEGFWSELPPELLELIALRLGIIELLGFRSTCISWRSASVNASAEIERMPWFLLYDDGSKCSLINKSQSKLYFIDIPELEGANCIASDGGWLLVYRDGSIFFFCPFSRARIDLPPLPDSSFPEYVGAISSSPTSQDCIVCVIHRQDSKNWVLNLIRRGATEWSKHVFVDNYKHLPNIMCAAYCGGIWYFRDSDSLVTFSSDKVEWIPYVVLSTKTSSECSSVLPFSAVRDHFRKSKMEKILGRREPFSISICGAKVLPVDDHNCQVFNENITEPDALHLKGVWIVPRFNQLPPNYSW